jgi:hypothetical protein
MEILIKHVSNLLVPGELSRVFFDSARKSGIYEHVSFLFAAFFLQVGEYQPSFAATACHPCEPGTSSRGKTGSQACSPCEPGQEAVVNGAERCIPCKRGFYSEAMAWAQQKSWRIEKHDIPRHLQRKRSIIREPLKVRWFMMV